MFLYDMIIEAFIDHFNEQSSTPYEDARCKFHRLSQYPALMIPPAPLDFVPGPTTT